MAQWLLITSVIFLASTLQSMTGFGFAVLAVPLLVPLLPPRDAVALITVLSTATTVLAWWRIRAETAPGWTWRLFTAGLFGVPLGIGALVSLPADWLRVVVGLGSLVVASVLLWSHATATSCGHVSGTPSINNQPQSPRWAICNGSISYTARRDNTGRRGRRLRDNRPPAGRTFGDNECTLCDNSAITAPGAPWV